MYIYIYTIYIYIYVYFVYPIFRHTRHRNAAGPHRIPTACGPARDANMRASSTTPCACSRADMGDILKIYGTYWSYMYMYIYNVYMCEICWTYMGNIWKYTGISWECNKCMGCTYQINNDIPNIIIV